MFDLFQFIVASSRFLFFTVPLLPNYWILIALLLRILDFHEINFLPFRFVFYFVSILSEFFLLCETDLRVYPMKNYNSFRRKYYLHGNAGIRRVEWKWNSEIVDSALFGLIYFSS